jgi:hypothetical protein
MEFNEDVKHVFGADNLPTLDNREIRIESCSENSPEKEYSSSVEKENENEELLVND